MEVFENLSASSRLPRAELGAYSRTVRDVTGSLEPAVISIGAAMESAAPDRPAERAGLRPGDVILGFGEEPVRSTDDLLRLLDEPAIGRDTTLRVLRGGREVPVEARPTEAPERTAG